MSSEKFDPAHQFAYAGLFNRTWTGYWRQVTHVIVTAF
jgi:hypothetical protein